MIVVKARRLARHLLKSGTAYAAIQLCQHVMMAPWRAADLGFPDCVIEDERNRYSYAFWHEVIYQVSDMEKEGVDG